VDGSPLAETKIESLTVAGLCSPTRVNDDTLAEGVDDAEELSPEESWAVPVGSLFDEVELVEEPVALEPDEER